MNRCLWCNGSDGELRTVALRDGKERREVKVHVAHEAPLVAWHARVARETPHFVTVFAFAPLLLLAAVGVAALVGRTAALLVVGLALGALAAFTWRYPFATPQTVRLVGVRRSIALVRGATALLAVGGTIAVLAALARLGA